MVSKSMYKGCESIPNCKTVKGGGATEKVIDKTSQVICSKSLVIVTEKPF